MPDFFDRLLARHAPARAGTPTGAPRLRPRLPGPFERGVAAESEGPEPARGTAAPGPATRATGPDRSPVTSRPVAPPAATVARPATALSRDRPPTTAVRPAPSPPVPAPPAVPPPLAAFPRRAAGRGRREDTGPAAPAGRRPARGAARSAQTQARAAGRPATEAVPLARPRPAERAVATTGSADRRRRHQPSERVVRVSIGRLEVTVEPRPAPTKPAGRGGPGDAGRARPSLTLDRYLSRGNGGGA